MREDGSRAAGPRDAEPDAGRSRGAGAWIALAALALVLFLAGNGRIALWDRDEPRFAEAAREMVATGDCVVPRFNGDLRTDKPPLIYWAMAAAYRAAGVDAFAARLPSALAGTAACLLAGALGARLFGRRTGLAAGAVLAASLTVWVESKTATADALLLACTTGATALLYRALDSRSTRAARPAALGGWLLLGLAVLAKGPIPLAVVAAWMLGFALLSPERGRLLRTGFWWGLPVSLLVALPWAWAVQAATDGVFLRHALGYHVVERSARAFESHGGFPGFYVATAPLAFFPWTGCLVPAVAAAWGRIRADRRLAFLVAWILGPLVVWELVATKLVHYLMPVHPAAAILVAWALLRMTPAAARWPRRAGAALTMLAGGLLGVGLPGAVLALGWRFALPGALAAGLLLSLSAAFVAAALWTGRGRAALAGGVSGFAAAALVLGLWAVPSLERIRPVRPAARAAVARAEEAAASPALYRFAEPSAVFYAGRTLPVLEDPDALRDFRREAGGVVLLTSVRKWEEDAPRLPEGGRILERFDGYNFAKGRPLSLLVIELPPLPPASASPAASTPTE